MNGQPIPDPVPEALEDELQQDPRDRTRDSSRLRRFVVVMTLVTTVLAAVVAGLEVNASSEADRANRESERLVVLGSNVVISAKADAELQERLLAQILTLSQDALVDGLSAAQLEAGGDIDGAAEARARAAVSDAKAARARALTPLYTDPRYAPSSADELPDLEAYLADGDAPAIELTRQQNAASDDYAMWSAKSDAYVGILSVLAVAFFLLGVGQVAGRTRALLATVATVMVVGSIGWTVVTQLG